MCNVVSLLGGVGPLETVESSSGPFLSTPTLATTPGDLAHCAWKVWHQDLGFERIQYKQRSTVGQWPQAAEDVSPWPDLPTEPASYPSVDAFGDRVYAAWRGMDLSVPPVSEAWRKERPLMGPPFDWTNPQNLSQSPGSESDYPQVSTPYAALLQEWRLFPTSNWDVWININGVPEHFFVSSDQSQYPDVAVVPPDPLHNYTDVHGVWTEGPLPGQNPPSYEVMYQMRRYSDLDRGEEFTYYDCEVGDSSRARYCLSRDGCVRWRNYRVDFGRSGLRYRLPHLNPNCIYKVITVLYQAGRDTWRQRFSLDGQPAGEVAYCPLVPETLWVTLPRELYRDDCAVELDIARLAGDYAVVAALKVYQFYPFREREGDMGNGQARRRTADPAHGFTLAEPAPNPSGRNLSVAYSVPTAGAVALRVYDAQGRLVTTLTSGPHSAGEHRARWDGRNAHGLRVATGTYFVRLESQSACLTRKAVLTR
jgi:hypothetical protein